MMPEFALCSINPIYKNVFSSASPKAFPERNFKRQTTPTIDFGKYGGVGTEPHPEKE